ncbi:MAG: ABC transporter ATP-binding protein [Clostridia bacterium]|nr:ABC transporter ATP-binding protein [Clostridia bacterium]
MIEVKNLGHDIDEKIILTNVNLTLQEGSVMGLVGINGAGKTTLLRLISGVYTVKQGEILIDGKSVAEEDAREQLFFLPDDPYFTIYTTGENLYKMYKVFYPGIDREIFVQFMKNFSLDPKKPIRNFSKGMRRQLYISLALAVKPKYLLLDEAFDGLDPLSRLTFKRALNEFVEQYGTSVIISSHSLRELEDFCDTYVLLDNMTVSSSGDIAEKVNRFCKFQLAFLEEISDDAFAHLPVTSLEKSGRFVRVVLEGNSTELLPLLQKLNPAVIEEMPMDFEEIFIHEVENRGYLK